MKKLLSIVALLLSLCACTKSSNIELAPAGLTAAVTHSTARVISTSSTYQLLSFASVRVSTGSKITWTAVGETKITGYDLQVSFNNRLFSIISGTTPFTSSNMDTSITRNYNSNYTTGVYSYDFKWYYRLKIYYANNTVGYGPVDSVKVLVNEKKFNW